MSVDYDVAVAALSERLSEPGFEHSVRTAQTAEALATIYGVDARRARLAGLLHDWDREIPREELPARAQASGVELTPTDEAAPYLLHALTGSSALSVAFPGIGQDVLHAVERHTIGAEQMTDLDRVVWLADMIEPGRRFPGVDDIREAVGELDLDQLFAMAYEHSLLHLIRNRKRIHPETVAVWNALVSGGDR